MFHFLKRECADWDRIGDVWNQEHLSQLPEQPCSMVAAICTSTEFPYLHWSQSTAINRLPFAYSWPDFLFLVLPYSIRHHFTCDPKLVTWQLPWDKSIPCYYLLPFLPCWQEAWRASRLGTIRRSQNDSRSKSQRGSAFSLHIWKSYRSSLCVSIKFLIFLWQVSAWVLLYSQILHHES